MMEPSKIRKAARQYTDENHKFRQFLRTRADPDELDKHFAELHNELFAEYDCCRCHNCCEAYSVELSDEDAGRIAVFLGLGKEAFVQKYAQNTDAGYEINPPCPFLERDGKCRIQPCKPDECRGYPYTDQPDRIASLYGVMEFVGTCPVVFEIVQRLKAIYGFRSRG
jgi:Fe-S-cluster containining protein